MPVNQPNLSAQGSKVPSMEQESCVHHIYTIYTLSHKYTPSSSCPPLTLLPLPHRILPPTQPRIKPVTPLTQNPPRPLPHNVLHSILIPQDTPQHLRSRLPREKPPAIRIQPLVHNPMTLRDPVIPHPLCIRVIWIRRCRHDTAIRYYL